MESPSYNPTPHSDASRPSLGFPLGTALLLIVIFSLSGVFTCCYHWDKLRSLHRSFSDADPRDPDSPAHDTDPSLSKPKPAHTSAKGSDRQSLPVIMPADRVAKFIALPCPPEAPREEKIVVQVQKPPPIPFPHLALPPY